MMLPKDFNDFAIKRTAVVLKNGIIFDRSLRDMLANAYACGFIDCCEANVNQRNHENAKQEQLHQLEIGNDEGKV